MRSGHGLILTCWRDDEGHLHSGRIPKDNVRRLTASEWDVIQYHPDPRRPRQDQIAPCTGCELSEAIGRVSEKPRPKYQQSCGGRSQPECPFNTPYGVVTVGCLWPPTQTRADQPISLPWPQRERA